MQCKYKVTRTNSNVAEGNPNCSERVVTAVSGICHKYLHAWFGEVVNNCLSKCDHCFFFQIDIHIEATVLENLGLIFWKPLCHDHLVCASTLKNEAIVIAKASCTIRNWISSFFWKTLLKSFCFFITQVGYVQAHRNNVGLNFLKVVKQFQIFCEFLYKYEILEDNFVLDLRFGWS